MGKKRRLNKLISKWIKSDLPEDRTTVLLLGVTRIPTSPLPARRPSTLTHPNSHPQKGPVRRTNSRRDLLRRNSSRRRQPSETCTLQTRPDDLGETPKLKTLESAPSGGDSVMERSVDSIGTCSLDIEKSAEFPDWADASSVATLKSSNRTPTSALPPTSEHLPSYLSLACTVNGYSNITNYDSGRLARSRDASPHRLEPDIQQKTYIVQNNLLSPPNLVPLPVLKSPKMVDNTLIQHHQEFYSSKKTMSFCSNIFSSDTIDGCLENGTYQSKCVTYESKNTTVINGNNKLSETITNGKETFTNGKETITNGKETKSFIQQRVERLYGPGALAQGFFVSKRQKNRLSISDCEKNLNVVSPNDKHSKSMQDKLMLDEDSEYSMKQSASSPTLPVMRHLRPEFRAQLPVLNPRKEIMHKSITVPKLKDEVNGHMENDVKEKENINPVKVNIIKPVENGVTGEKDGHYFLKILDEQAERLLGLADITDTELNKENLTEDVIGKIRSASGKARLLVTQKMQQFKGLCTNNINHSDGEAFPTTNEDLQGFWDMVMLQVNQVDKLFEEIMILKKNNWKEPKPVEKSSENGTKPRKLLPRPKSTTNAANDEARKQREAQRKKIIEERRKMMKAQQQKNMNMSECIEIFVPESS